jgi:redox-sensitive bicupin YhaK (pirin superfamily)
VEYFDVTLTFGNAFEQTPKKGYRSFAYVIDGMSFVGGALIEPQHCALFDEGENVKIYTRAGAHFLFVSGKPLNEPVAWGGPIVMNTQEELERAFQEIDEGTFIKRAKIAKPSKNFYRN